MFDLKALLRLAIKQKASDVHLHANSVPFLRVKGELVPFSSHPLITKQDTLDLVQIILNSRQKEALGQKSEIDISFAAAGLGRYRLAVYNQRSSIALAFRLIPENVPGIDELHLPPVIRDLTNEPRGLILVTGATGSGKSTTLAAMLQYVNLTRRAHILTIEDPVEFQLKDVMSIISQREVEVDTPTFGSALRAAMRQDPDIIMVGEMRDYDTVMTAMQAAETGHLVLTTLHTADTTETVNRIIAMFPDAKQNDVRYRFAASMRAIISMRLIKSSVDGEMYPCVEVLRNTETIRAIIETPERARDIRKAVEAGHSQYKMQSFDQAILQLLEGGLISHEDALENATAPEDLKLRIEGIVSSSETV